MTSSTDRIWELVSSLSYCFLVSNVGEHARPMAAIVKEEEGRVYFLTDLSSAKLTEIRQEPRVTLTFSDGHSKFATLNGQAAIDNNRALIKRLWNPGAQAFWPEGPTAPNVTAIVVTPTHGEYWDGPSGILAGVKMAFAIATGSRPDLGDNEKVKL
jgi:general stress protein 26